MPNVFFKTRPIHELQPFKFEMWISMSIQKKGGDTKEVKGLGPVSFLFIFFQEIVTFIQQRCIFHRWDVCHYIFKTIVNTFSNIDKLYII